MTLAGCIPGAIYTHTIQPLSTDLNLTPVAGGGAKRGDVKQVRFRMVDVRWDENAIGELARPEQQVFLPGVDEARVELDRFEIRVLHDT